MRGGRRRVRRVPGRDRRADERRQHANDWATCLTVEQLKTIWEPGSKVSNWNQVDPSFPDVPLKLYGPGTDSGTFDYFTDVINGEEGASRTDFSASEDDNVIVQGVSGDEGGLGLLRVLVLRGEPGHAEGARGRRRLRLRRAERRRGAGRHVHAALATALRVREAQLVRRTTRRRRLRDASCSRTRGDRRGGAVRRRSAQDQIAEQQPKLEDATS